MVVLVTLLFSLMSLILPAALAAEPVVITLWSDHGFEDAPLFQVIARRFEEEHPNIIVNVENQADGYYNKLVVAAAAGQLPDIFYVRGGSGDMAYHAKGFSLDLTPFITRDAHEVEIDDFHPSQIPELMYQGEWRALPYDYSVQGIYYNRNLFQSAGLPDPEEEWTWEDFAEIARRLTRRASSGEITQWGVTNFGFGQFLEGYLMSFGGRLFSEDYSRAVVGSDPASRRALEFARALATEHEVVYISGFAGNPFFGGVSGMMIAGSWDTMWIGANMPFEWDVQVLPGGPEGTRVVTATGGGWSIAATSQHPEEAWQFLKYLTSRESSRFLIVEPVRSLPARRSLLPEWAEHVERGSSARNAMAFGRALERYSKNAPTIPYDYVGPIYQLWGPILTSSERSITDLSLELEQRINSILASGGELE